MCWLPRFQALEWLVILAVIALLGVIILPDDLGAAFDRNLDNTLPINQIVPSDLVNESTAAVQLIMIARRPNPSGGEDIDFALLNTSATPVYYIGFTPRSFRPRLKEGQVRPTYTKQVETEHQWDDKRVFRCGNGMATMCLKPGQAGLFRASRFPDEQTIRIAINWASTKSGPSKDDAVLLSPVISAND